jgi:hypothetical protein
LEAEDLLPDEREGRACGAKRFEAAVKAAGCLHEGCAESVEDVHGLRQRCKLPAEFGNVDRGIGARRRLEQRENAVEQEIQ